MFRFECGLCPRNRILGEASEGGRSPPPSCLTHEDPASRLHPGLVLGRVLERAGHEVTLACKRGSGPRVIDRARDLGVQRIETLDFASGVKPGSDVRDVRRLIDWLAAVDVVHVHRGKEHWLAAIANRLCGT